MASSFLWRIMCVIIMRSRVSIQVSMARFIFANIRFITAVRSIKLEKRVWL